MEKGVDNTLNLVDPAALKQFLLFNEGLFDGISAQFQGAKFNTITGGNLVVAELKYEASTIAGSSYSWYFAPDNGCPSGNCQQF